MKPLLHSHTVEMMVPLSNKAAFTKRLQLYNFINGKVNNLLMPLNKQIKWTKPPYLVFVPSTNLKYFLYAAINHRSLTGDTEVSDAVPPN